LIPEEVVFEVEVGVEVEVVADPAADEVFEVVAASELP
jgi:hypothetical protein